MKKSLIISDKEKYGSPSPATVSGPEKPEDRKSGVSVELTGKQVDAFCACSLKPGDKGTATVHYVVKSISAGDQYGSGLPQKGSGKQKATLILTHVEAVGKPENEETQDDEDKETPEEEALEDSQGEEGEDHESDAEEASESEDENSDTDKETGLPKKKRGGAPVSVKDTGLDE